MLFIDSKDSVFCNIVADNTGVLHVDRSRLREGKLFQLFTSLPPQ